MKITRINRFRLLVLAAALFLFAPGLSVPALSADLPVVEFGLPSGGVFGLGGQYMIDKKLDRKHGFIAKPRWGGVANVERLIAINAIPVGLATVESALRANTKGIHLKLVQPYMRTMHNFILVRKDSPYKTIMDLKGKSIAVPQVVTSAYNLFDFMMRKQGVEIEKEFQLKKMGAAGIIAVMERGDVEAALHWEAHVTRMLASGKYRSLSKLGDVITKVLNKDIHLFGWVGAQESWAKKNPELIVKIRAAWQEMIAGVQNDPDHFRKYAKKIFGLEGKDVVDLAYKRVRPFLLPPDFKWPNPKNLANQKQYLKDGIALGIFPKESEPFIDGLFVP